MRELEATTRVRERPPVFCMATPVQTIVLRDTYVLIAREYVCRETTRFVVQGAAAIRSVSSRESRFGWARRAVCGCAYVGGAENSSTCVEHRICTSLTLMLATAHQMITKLG